MGWRWTNGNNKKDNTTCPRFCSSTISSLLSILLALLALLLSMCVSSGFLAWWPDIEATPDPLGCGSFRLSWGQGLRLGTGKKIGFFGAGRIFWAWNKKSFVADIGMCIPNRLTSSTCSIIFCLRLIGLKQIERKLNLFPCAFPSKQPRCTIPTAKTSTERQLRIPDAQHTSVQSWLRAFALMWPWMTIYLFIIDTRGISLKSNPFPCRIEPGDDQIG